MVKERFTQTPLRSFTTPHRTIHSFVSGNEQNFDATTVESFGEEWKVFHGFTKEEIDGLGELYFDIVTDKMVNQTTIIGDFGCGSGRFIKYWQQKAGFIVGIDPSQAIFAADELLGNAENVELCQASISNMPYPDDIFDFGMSIGVLHHIPDTQQAMTDCVKKVKKGGYFYTYLYYSFDNRGLLFKALWWFSNLLRIVVSGLPQTLKKFVCELLAVVLYMPFVILCRLLKAMGVPWSVRSKIPLFAYEDKTFYIIRNDSLDRFGTPLEQRFSRAEVIAMMQGSGLTDIIVSDKPGYWHAVGRKM